MANNNQQRGPYLPNYEPFIAAGIDPKTGLPKKLEGASAPIKQNIKALLRVLDEQNAVTRYTWYNLPCDITSQELERMLYYKGQLCMFYFEPLDKFFFMPYALDGTIDFYGRFNRVHPVPMAEGQTDIEKEQFSKQRDLLSTIKLDVLYDIPLEPVNPYTSCVLLHDYTKQMSQTIISRQVLQDPLLDVMSECVPLLRTALFNSSGVTAMRVNSQDEQSNVQAANASIDLAALNGQRYIPVLGNLDFQELAAGDTLKSEEFLIAMQSLDNLRLSFYGLDNGGLFQKKAHMLEAEQQANAGHAKSPLDDGLMIRQHMCDVANAIWGIGMSCEISETALGADKNGDMFAVDNQDQTGIPGEQPQEVAQNVE